MHKLAPICSLVLALVALSSIALAVDQEDDNDPNYWLRRRDLFYRATRFNLTDGNLRLLGLKRTNAENWSAFPSGHLPFWFDYALFKKVFNKPNARNSSEHLARHNAYISTCMRLIKVRTLFRMLAGTQDAFITEDADKFYWEKFGHYADELQGQVHEDEISLVSNLIFGPDGSEDESPIMRAVRLMKQEMERVEAKNQVEWYLRAFRESDGSAIAGKLPY